jgi:hypothetical protein
LFIHKSEKGRHAPHDRHASRRQAHRKQTRQERQKALKNALFRVKRHKRTLYHKTPKNQAFAVSLQRLFFWQKMKLQNARITQGKTPCELVPTTKTVFLIAIQKQCFFYILKYKKVKKYLFR